VGHKEVKEVAVEPVKSADPGDRLYSAVYRALLAGMMLSTLLFAAGILMTLAVHAPIVAEALAPFSWRVLRSGNPLPLFALATCILILTPMARVAVAAVAFLLDRDYKFAAISAAVLTIVLMTLLFQVKFAN
jgi:uncharacterized membrane protein